ncbi:MAG: hypothetical protein QOI63_1686, partial [Thermoplasmata archaeon]|nr:hypothetical protein [Thermoplasmata archaeon]
GAEPPAAMWGRQAPRRAVFTDASVMGMAGIEPATWAL